MQLRRLALAAVATLSVHAAHALPSNTIDLGVDPFTEPFAAGTSLYVPGGVESSFTFELTQMSNLYGQLKQVQNDVTVTSISLSGGSLLSPSVISLPESDSGEFTFSYLSAGNYTLSFTAVTSSIFAMYSGAVTATPVPEAGSIALALAGLGVVGLVASRRKQAH